MKDEKYYRELIKKLDEEYPFIIYVGISRLYSAVRRMNADRVHNIPYGLRSHHAISVKTGKSAQEMAEKEWNEFFDRLRAELKRENAGLYYNVFPEEKE